MSTSSNDNKPPKPTPPTPTASVPSTEPPPPPSRPDFFTTIRRFSDHQFSSILHSLIGVPTIVNQPTQPPKNWILDSDLPADHPDHPRPRTRRSGSDSLVDEIKRIREDDSGGSDDGNGEHGGGGGMGIQRTVSSTSSTAGGSTGTGNGTGDRSQRDAAATTATTTPPAIPRDPAVSGLWLGEALWKPFESLQESQLMWGSPPRSPLLEEMVSFQRRNSSYTGVPTRHNGDQTSSGHGLTELDYYEFFEKQMAGMRKAMGGANSVPAVTMTSPEATPRTQYGMKVESRYEETRTVRDRDGTLKMKRIQVRRFPDGREERVEIEDTRLPNTDSTPRTISMERRPEMGVLQALERSRTTH